MDIVKLITRINIILFLTPSLWHPLISTTLCQAHSHREIERLHQDLLRLMKEQIQIKQEKLSSLEKLYDVESRAQKYSYDHKEESSRLPDVNPIEYFVNLNRAIETAQRMREIVDETDDDIISFGDNLNDSLLIDGQSLSEYMNEYVESILRFQRFYNVSVDDMARGVTGLDSSTPTEIKTIMGWHECYVVAMIAYEKMQYDLAIGWFLTTLELLNSTLTLHDNSIHNQSDHIELYNSDFSQTIVTTLDHLAYSAYHEDDMGLAISATSAWLEYEPDNERALSNLYWYHDAIVKGMDRKTASQNQLEEMIKQFYDGNQPMDLNFYEPSRDLIARHLCSSANVPDTTTAKCYTKLSLTSGHLSPELRLEVLNIRPRVVRIYDVISQVEAEIIRNLSKPNLSRSTVKSGDETITSKFRVAKTSWLSSKDSPVIGRLEQRLSKLLNLNMDHSEALQVVSYTFGGFYGPHLDAQSRKEESESTNPFGDRLATVLIYLNHVQQGGATVFPRLNLSVVPIERSAVVWRNIKDDDSTNQMTVHTGCPVFNGDKWIATKWPRVRANRRAVCPIMKAAH